MDTDLLKKMLMAQEGIQTKFYIDTMGRASVGVGRNLQDVGLSIEEVNLLFANDIERVVEQATEAFPWLASLSDVRQSVVLSMCFNLGVHGFAAFLQTIAFIKLGKWPDAAREMLNSKWATQVGQRAKVLATMLQTDMTPDAFN